MAHGAAWPRVAVSICVLLGGLLVLPPVTHAQTTTGTMVISPAFQEVVLQEKTASTSAAIELRNLSQVDQVFRLQGIEIQQFDAQGNISFQDRPLRTTDQNGAQFLTLPSELVTVPAGQLLQVPFQITNSITLSPGGHYAALVARLENQPTDTQILPALSAFILVKKEGGEHYNLSLKTTSLLKQIWWRIPQHFDLTFSNQGNVHVVPRGSLEITDAFGRLIAQSTLNESSFYVFPGTQREIQTTIRMVQFPVPGVPLKIKLSGHSDPGQVTFAQTGWVLYLPYPVVGIAVIGGCSSGAYLLWRKHQRKPYAKTQ